MKTLGIGTLNRIDKSWGEEKTETDKRAVGKSENQGEADYDHHLPPPD